jgi:hypothetical protein
MSVKYEEMQRVFSGHIKTPTEHELWNLWIAKDEDYRLVKIMAWLGWVPAVTGTLAIIFW